MTGAVVLATNQGLGYLAKDFYDNGLIDKVYIKQHSSRLNNPEWYKPEAHVKYLHELLECDTILFFEEAWEGWKLIPMARARGIKTVLMPMYECTRYPFPYEPDLILCPSELDYDFYKRRGKNVLYVPVPVDVEWKERTRARVFIHNAGNGGIGGRNGTKELVEAMKYVQSDLSLIIRSQVPIPPVHDPRVRVQVGTIPPEDLWSHGDVFVFPEKFNGLSLPLQEAHAAGMLVMAGDRFPINAWLPKAPLIPVDHYTKERISVEFKCAHYAPETIASIMDKWYDADITKYSHAGRDWAIDNSWKRLREIYLKLLSR